MSDRAALIRAICQTPAEDTPRLMLADWYEEHYEAERGALIRDMIANAAVDPDTFAECCSLTRDQVRQWNLWPKTCWNVLAFLRVARRRRAFVMGNAYFQTVVRRGLIESIRLPMQMMLDYAHLFREHPITSVRIGDRIPDADPKNTGRFGWHDERTGSGGFTWKDHPSFLPTEIFKRLYPPAMSSKRLIDFTWPRYLSLGLVPYSSREEAITGLSRACVDYGRSLAQLEPISYDDYTEA